MPPVRFPEAVEQSIAHDWEYMRWPTSVMLLARTEPLARMWGSLGRDFRPGGDEDEVDWVKVFLVTVNECAALSRRVALPAAERAAKAAQHRQMAESWAAAIERDDLNHSLLLYRQKNAKGDGLLFYEQLPYSDQERVKEVPRVEIARMFRAFAEYAAATLAREKLSGKHDHNAARGRWLAFTLKDLSGRPMYSVVATVCNTLFSAEYSAHQVESLVLGARRVGPSREK